MKAWLLLAGLLACVAQALADPQVRVQTRLQPAAPYQVGSTLRLEIDLLTTTWFTQAPQPPALDLPGMLVTPPNGQADKLTESSEGTTWFGLRLTYLISPTEPGQYRIPALPFRLRLGQASGVIEASSQAVDFNVDGTAPDNPADSPLVASRVRMSQQIERPAQVLKVGDRLTRRIRIEADEAQAMLIPPVVFGDIPGLRRYPQPPEVTALGNGRGSIDGGLRIDSVSYVVEQPGDYVLPAVELHWRNSRSQAGQTSSVPEVEFEAERSGGQALPFSLEADLERLGRGRLIRVSAPLTLLLAAGLLLGLLGYLGRHRLRQARLALHDWRLRRRAAWQASEACAWQELQRALRREPLPLAQLYRWQLRSQGQADLQRLAEQLPAVAAASLRQGLLRQYGQPAGARGTSHELARALRQLRRQRMRTARQRVGHFQLQPLRPWPDCMGAASEARSASDRNAGTQHPQRD